MNPQAKVISAFAGVFAAGAVCGGFFALGTVNRSGSTTAAVTTPEAAPVTHTAAPIVTAEAAKAPVPRSQPTVRPTSPSLMRTYTRRLNLTGEQRAAIEPMFAKADEELRRLRDQNLQDTTRVMNGMYADISSALTEDQRVELETMRRKLQERMDQERKKMKEENGARKDQKGAPIKPPS